MPHVSTTRSTVTATTSSVGSGEMPQGRSRENDKPDRVMAKTLHEFQGAVVYESYKGTVPYSVNQANGTARVGYSKREEKTTNVGRQDARFVAGSGLTCLNEQELLCVRD